MKTFGIRRCEKCGAWLIVRLYIKRKQCPNCGHKMKVVYERRRLEEVYAAFANSIQEAQELIKRSKTEK